MNDMTEMTDKFKKLIAMLLAEDIQFTVHYSVGGTWFVRDSAVSYENHRWEVDDKINLVFWTRQNGFSRSVSYHDLDDCIYAVKKTLGVN